MLSFQNSGEMSNYRDVKRFGRAKLLRTIATKNATATSGLLATRGMHFGGWGLALRRPQREGTATARRVLTFQAPPHHGDNRKARSRPRASNHRAKSRDMELDSYRAWVQTKIAMMSAPQDL
jgi:hypothetical protein